MEDIKEAFYNVEKELSELESENAWDCNMRDYNVKSNTKVWKSMEIIAKKLGVDFDVKKYI